MKKQVQYIIGVFLLYLTTLLINNTGFGMQLLMVAIPIGVFVLSALNGYRNGVQMMYPVWVAVLFIPFAFIVMKQWDTMIYGLIYAVVSAVGVFVGSMFNKNR